MFLVMDGKIEGSYSGLL